MSLLKTTIEWGEDGEEREILVTYNYHPAQRGARDSLGGIRGAGPPLEPDEPEQVEIESVAMLSPTFHDRQHTEEIKDDLTPEQMNRLEEKCMADVQDRREAAMENQE